MLLHHDALAIDWFGMESVRKGARELQRVSGCGPVRIATYGGLIAQHADFLPAEARRLLDSLCGAPCIRDRRLALGVVRLSNDFAFLDVTIGPDEPAGFSF